MLGAEGFEHCLVGLQIRPLDEIDAVGHGGEHRIQAIGNGRGLARQIDQQGTAADAGDLPRRKRGQSRMALT